jgi:hypothetical protein
MQIKAGGYEGWRWIFIVEGLMPIVLAALGYLIIVDFPDKIRLSRRPFLTEHEIQVTKDRLEADRGDSEFDQITLQKALAVLAKWNLWL